MNARELIRRFLSLPYHTRRSIGVVSGAVTHQEMLEMEGRMEAEKLIAHRVRELGLTERFETLVNGEYGFLQERGNQPSSAQSEDTK